MNATRVKPLTFSESFARAIGRQRIGLIPFVPAGYPDLATTAALLPALERAGATVIEVGFPFTDPIADGPIIQEAFVEALANKVRISDVLATVAGVRQSVSIPIVGMLSYSIVFRYGIDRFIADAKKAGLNGLILPDLPPPEAQRIVGRIRAGGLETILLVAPSTSASRRAEIARLSSGFVYYLSIAGVTGERDRLPADLPENLRKLREVTQLPICVGFGISQPRHIAELAPMAGGAIVGSAIVRRIRDHRAQGPEAIAQSVADLAAGLLSQVRLSDPLAT